MIGLFGSIISLTVSKLVLKGYPLMLSLGAGKGVLNLRIKVFRSRWELHPATKNSLNVLVPVAS